MKRLRWRDQLQTRIFVPMAAVTVAVAAILVAVAIRTINEGYEKRLTEQLLSQQRFAELTLRGMEQRLSLYARSMADVHRLSETAPTSRIPASIPRTVLESMNHDGMSIQYHRDLPADHPSFGLASRALPGEVAIGVVAKRTPEGTAYFLEGMARVHQKKHDHPGFMAVDLHLSERLLSSLRGGQANLSIVAEGNLVASTLRDRRAAKWVVGRAGQPDVVSTVIDQGNPLITSYNQSIPPRRVLLAPLRKSPDNRAVMAYDLSLEPLIEARKRILWRGLPAAGLGLLILFASYGLFIRRVTRPLKQLSEATAAVASGNLDTKLTTRAVGELKSLAEGFTKMVEDLRVSHRENEEWNRRLEDRVAERTQQLKEAQGELVRAGKLAAIGELAAGLAHELRNPLAVIRMSANYLAKRLPPGEKNRKHEQIMNEEIERIDKLIEDLLESSRPKSMEFESVRLSDVIDKSIALAGLEISSRGIETTVSVDPSTPEVMLDTNQMSQVLINLIINACQAMPKGGKLKLRTTALQNGQEKPEKVRIEVTDTGEGIPPDAMESIFTPFFTTKDSGTGLGLSVSQRIVRSHHGEIRAASRLGEGTTFVITLPVQQKGDTDHA